MFWGGSIPSQMNAVARFDPGEQFALSGAWWWNLAAAGGYWLGVGDDVALGADGAPRQEGYAIPHRRVLHRPAEPARQIRHYVNPAKTIILKCD